MIMQSKVMLIVVQRIVLNTADDETIKSIPDDKYVDNNM